MSATGDFILPVDKPEGPTSHDVVRAVRKALDERRVGHTGTLDPFASGLLLICVGRATRLAEYLSAQDKTYDAVALLGVSTDTLDRDGAVVRESSGWESLDERRVEAVLERFRGDIEQMPPVYSAKKVAGVAAHRRARRGEAVELAPTRVRIDELGLTSLDLPRLALRVTCSSGTYVRSLARDIGEALGVGAHLVSLRRTRVGDFTVDGALRFEHLDDASRFAEAALDPLQAVRHLPTIDIDDDAVARIVQGGSVATSDDAAAGTVALAHAGSLVAIGECADGMVHPRKVFAP